LERFDVEGEDFLPRIVIGDATWVHHFEQETKRQSLEWHHPQSPRKKKFKTAPSAGKVMVTVFWDCDEVLLVDVMPRGVTTDSEAYISTLKQLKKRFRRVRPGKNPEEMLLRHDNARPHKPENPGTHHQNVLDGAVSSTLQPRSATVGLPPLWVS
jgi:hypothetical protein